MDKNVMSDLIGSSKREMGPCPGGCGVDMTIINGHPMLCRDCMKRNLEQQRTEEHNASVAHFEENLEQQLAACGIPVRYRSFTRGSWEKTYKDWDTTKLMSIRNEQFSVNQILEGFISGDSLLQEGWLIVLFGKHGTRKTSLGTAMFIEAMRALFRKMPERDRLSGHIIRQPRPVWLDAEEWADALEFGLRESDDPSWRPTAEVFTRAAKAQLLMIDDLGAIRAQRTGNREQQDWWKERIAHLLRQREMNCLRTIVTSNLGDLNDLASINHSLPGRMSVRWSFKIGGKDFRGGA